MEDPRRREVAMAVILTIITCGIYGLYWLAEMHDDLERESGQYSGTSGTMVVVLSIITCGIYELYWLYKAGEKCSAIKYADRADPNAPYQSDEGVLYLVLGIFGLSIVSYALIQSTLNDHYYMQDNGPMGPQNGPMGPQA